MIFTVLIIIEIILFICFISSVIFNIIKNNEFKEKKLRMSYKQIKKYFVEYEEHLVYDDLRGTIHLYPKSREEIICFHYNIQKERRESLVDLFFSSDDIKRFVFYRPSDKMLYIKGKRIYISFILHVKLFLLFSQLKNKISSYCEDNRIGTSENITFARMVLEKISEF